MLAAATAGLIASSGYVAAINRPAVQACQTATQRAPERARACARA